MLSDSNGSGTITKKEFKMFWIKNCLKQKTNLNFEDMFKALDTNND